MKRFTLMVSFLTLLCLNIVAQNFELDENKQIFSNMFTEEEYRTSTSVLHFVQVSCRGMLQSESTLLDIH